MLIAVQNIFAVFVLTFSGLISLFQPAPPPPLPSSVAVVQELPLPVAENAATVAADSPDALSLVALQDCLNRASGSGACLDGIFRQYLKIHTTADALAALARYEVADSIYRLACHPVIHALGRETFRQQGNVHDSFAACDQSCHSGCYHGAMERFLRGSAAGDDEAGHISVEELRAKAAGACDPNQPTRFRFQCLHGLGHAILFFSDYRLAEALASCDALPDAWSRSSCYGGLFMENVFSATPEKRDLSPTDYHYPCTALDAKYQGDCYMMQTTRMSEMGLDTAGLFAECRRAGAHRSSCMQSIGRDLSNDARVGDPRAVSAKCELGTGEERRSCTRGVVYALIDNTWDGRYAFPFCASFADRDDVVYCFVISSAYLQSTYAKTEDDISGECRRYAPNATECARERL